MDMQHNLSDIELWQAMTGLRHSSDSVRYLGPDSHNVTSATIHIYKPTNQDTPWNDMEYTGKIE